VPATLPQVLGSHCLHAPPPLGSPHAKSRNIISALPAFASTHSQRSWPPMHAAYHGGPATSAAPSLRDSVSATLPQHLRTKSLHAPPALGSPLAQPPPPAPAPRATASAHSPQLHLCAAGVCKHPLTAQLAADARSIPPRTSDVSCVILTRLGVSDAAPAALTQLSACIAAPRLAPRKPPPTRYSPTRNRHSPKHAASSMHCRRSQEPTHSAAARRCTQRTTEVQRRQLRHP
jgi:hypothetical protein